MNRETWLNELAKLMAPRFEELGKPLPKFRAAIGFTSGGMRSKASAECWNRTASADGAFEIYISPDTQDSMKIAGSLAHELTHAAVGFDHGHKGDFSKTMAALGFKAPWTTTVPTEASDAWLKPLVDALGPVPHAALRWPGSRGAAPTVKHAEGGEDQGGDEGEGEGEGEPAEPVSTSAKKKQTTRLKKCTCETCGYTVRVTQKWLDVGRPGCPEHGPMAIEGDE